VGNFEAVEIGLILLIAVEGIANGVGGDLKRCIQLCSTTPVTAHRQMPLRRMFCGGLLISPHPVAAHHSTSIKRYFEQQATPL